MQFIKTNAYIICTNDIDKRSRAMIDMLRSVHMHPGHRGYKVRMAMRLVVKCEHEGRDDLVVKLEDAIEKTPAIVCGEYGADSVDPCQKVGKG